MSENGVSRPARSMSAASPTRPPAPGPVPIYQTTSYEFRDTEHAAEPVRPRRDRQRLHPHHEPDAGGARGPRRTRSRAAAPRPSGCPARSPSASGQAAETLAILNLAEAGDHIVSSPSLYGGTYNLFHYTLPKLGIEVTFVDDPDDLEQWRAADPGRTRRLFFGETLANPKNDVFDIEGVGKVAHEDGIPLIVDNTVPTPYLIRPIEWGADIVVHSLTKFIGGHGTSIGGSIIDGGTFDSRRQGRFPDFTEPDPSYHGLRVLAGARRRLVHPQGARAAAARPRRADLAVQRLPDPAGPRDAEPAHGAPLRQRPEGRRVPRRRRARC